MLVILIAEQGNTIITYYFINWSELPGFLSLKKIFSHARDIISFTCEDINFVTFADEFPMFQC